MQLLKVFCISAYAVVFAQTTTKAEVPTGTISAAPPITGLAPGPILSDKQPTGNGSTVCGKQLIRADEYICFENRIPCLKLVSKLCGDSCYDPTKYHCADGQLVEGQDKNGLTDSSSPDTSALSGKHYQVPIPGPGAYGQLLHDLGRDGILTTDIEQIRDELNRHGIELTTPQVAVLLRDPMGSQAGLRLFESTLSESDRANFDEAMPDIKVILQNAAQRKLNPGLTGHSGHEAPKNTSGTSHTDAGVSAGSQPSTTQEIPATSLANTLPSGDVLKVLACIVLSMVLA